MRFIGLSEAEALELARLEAEYERTEKEYWAAQKALTAYQQRLKDHSLQMPNSGLLDVYVHMTPEQEAGFEKLRAAEKAFTQDVDQIIGAVGRLTTGLMTSPMDYAPMPDRPWRDGFSSL